MSDDKPRSVADRNREELEDRVSDLENVGIVTAKFVTQIRGAEGDEQIAYDDPEFIHTAIQTFGDLVDQLQEQQNAINRLESQLEAIQDLGREKTTKEEKITRLVNYAQNLSTDGESGRYVLEAQTIKGTAGVSRRYAYDLMDELPDKYDWALDRSEVEQYGDLEIDKDEQSRALVIDLDVLHTDGEAVNKFTTRTTSEGASA